MTKEVSDHLDGCLKEMESNVTRRIELFEKRLKQKSERTIIAAVAAGPAFLAIVIPLAVYLVG